MVLTFLERSWYSDYSYEKKIMNAEWLANLLTNNLIIDVNGCRKYPLRFVSVLIAINSSALRRSLSPDQPLTQFRSYMVDNSFNLEELALWRSCGVPEYALILIVKYYAFDAKRYITIKAPIIYRLMIELKMAPSLQK